MNNKERNRKSIHLWKLIVIIAIMFSIVISIEAFFLIEKTVKKMVVGFSGEYGSAILPEEEENSDNPQEGDATNAEDNTNETDTPDDSNTGSESPSTDENDGSEKQPTDEEKPNENVTSDNTTATNTNTVVDGNSNTVANETSTNTNTVNENIVTNTVNTNTVDTNTVNTNTVNTNPGNSGDTVADNNTVKNENTVGNSNTVNNQNVVSDNTLVDSDEEDSESNSTDEDEENSGEVYCKQIHTHSKICYEKDISMKDRERVFIVMQMIDELPTYEEIAEKLSEYEEQNDDDGYKEYFLRIKDSAYLVYSYYVDLINESPYLEEYITNAENLLNLTIMWKVETFAADVTYPVHSINKFGYADTAAIVYRTGTGTTVLACGSDGFRYWGAYVVEKKDNNFVVTDEDTNISNHSKGYITVPANGFVVLVHNVSKSFKGKFVTVSFDYTKYNNERNDKTKYGTVTFTDTAPNPPTPPEPEPGIEKVVKNNKLTPIKSASTKDLIRINLFDYTYGINTKYEKESPYYPAFRTTAGPTSFSDGKGANYNFAESIKTDMNATLNNGSNGMNAGRGNSSWQDVLSKTLINGYPAIKQGNSIGYLFGEESLSYVKKLNTANIDGLFQFDEKSEKYIFDSRKNCAKYENNEFKLFKEIITPDFIQYPFGNFLPLNDIQTAQKVIDVNPQYFETIKQSAYFKANKETDSTYKTAYSNLANALNGFIKAITPELPAPEAGTYDYWYEKILRKYALIDKAQGKDKNGVVITKGYTKELFKDTKHFSNLYCIDYDDKRNFHFGMTMEFLFIQEKNKNEEDVVYKFDGDDDVFVYIDNILFLELAGMHRQVGGKINFTKGEVYYYDFNETTGDVDTSVAKSTTFEEIINAAGAEIELEDVPEGGKRFKDNTLHKLKFYYLERGAGSSLCNMEFNMVLTPERCNVSGTKSWAGDEKDISSRPEKITIDLYKDGVYEKSTTTTAEEDWKYEFKDLVYIDANEEGTVHTYTVQERDLDDYVAVYEEDKENSTVDNKIINIKNYYIYKDIEVKKEWDDDVDDDTDRSEIKVDLAASVGNEEIEITQIGSSRDDVEITLSGENEWSYKWNKLPKYKDNDVTKEITYSIKEIGNIEGYFQSELKKDHAAGIIKLTNSKLRNIAFTKVDKDDNNILLEGAQFKLQKLNNKGEIDNKFAALESNVTSSDGKFYFYGLEYGKYALTEIKTPESYNTIKKPIYVELTKEKAIVTINDKSTEFTNSVNMDLGKIENKKGFILAETGGMGTKLFTITGIAILAFSINYVNSTRIVTVPPRRRKLKRRRHGKHSY